MVYLLRMEIHEKLGPNMSIDHFAIETFIQGRMQIVHKYNIAVSGFKLNRQFLNILKSHFSIILQLTGFLA